MQISNAGGRDHHAVSAAVVLRGGAVLLCHRHQDRQWFPDVWDLPGGHIEPGESSAAAIQRELLEELGIHAQVDGHAPVRSMEISSTLRIDVWVITQWTGQPTNLAPEEHDAIEWVPVSELDEWDLAHSALYAVIAEVST